MKSLFFLISVQLGKAQKQDKSNRKNLTGMYMKECRFFLVMLCQKIATLFPPLFQLIFITESLSYKKLLKNPQQMKKNLTYCFYCQKCLKCRERGSS